MQVWKSVGRLTSRVLHSRLGQILFVIHLVLTVYVYAERGSVTRPVHPYYESVWMNALIWLDLPGIILASTIAAPIAHQSSPLEVFRWSPWVAIGIAFVCTSLQWWCLGYLVARLCRRNKSVLSS